MLRSHWITNSAAAKAYYQVGDYYGQSTGEWLGKGAESLGLVGAARQEDFNLLCDNLNPLTGEPLTTYTRDDRRVGIDLNFNSTKSVGIIRELGGSMNEGDERVEVAQREAVAYAMGFVEADMRGRVRVGGKNEDRITGNMIAFRVTHRDTRVSGQDGMPDMSLHDHCVVFNATHDPVEDKWKAAEMGQIKHDAPYYEAIYHNRLAANLRDLGYGIRRKDKAFEVAGVSDELVKKFSRRRAYIDKVAEKLGITSAAGRNTLGATTRLGKSKEAPEDLNDYWVSRLTDMERQELTGLNGKPSYVCDETKAVEFAIGHMFERKSVVDERRLYETALRNGIGSVTPEDIQAEAKRQGLLVKAGEATTRNVLAEEGRTIAFARDGRGTCRAMGKEGQSIRESASSARHAEGTGHVTSDLATLSVEQQAIARHVWESPDRVIMIRGGAGTGKTRAMKTIIEGIDRPVVVLAPSAEASRKVLRDEGFAEADTVARFLIDEKFQQKAKGGVIWIDEAGLLGIRQVAQVFEIAKELGARVVLQGDKKQHASVERGATLRVLEEFAGLPVAELKDIRRQHGRYKEAVASLANGKMLAGFDRLNIMGWVKETPAVDHNKPLVDDYMAGLNAGKEMLVVAPTHIEGDQITAEIRERLKEREIVGKEGKQVETLVPLRWTDAEKGDVARYEGTEVMQFHRNSGTFRAGDRLRAVEWKDGDRYKSPAHFSVYSQGQIEVAAGDTIRITANGKTMDDKHKLNNGAAYQVKGFTKDGDIVLQNGWTIAKDFGHIAHGYVTTSHGSQGKTVDRVLIAMGNESLGAINAEQFYVSVSRGRESAKIYSDMSATTLREAILRSDVRKSATELMGNAEPSAEPKPKPNRDRRKKFMERVRDTFDELRERAFDAMRNIGKEREKELSRGRE